MRFLGADGTEADDLTQETFLAFARAEFAERDDRQTAGYLRTVARNQLLALRRKQNREIRTVELEAADSVWAAAAGPTADLHDYLDALRECVEQLEGRCRQAIDLHYRDGAGREAIADAARNETRRRQDTAAPHAAGAPRMRRTKTESRTRIA